MSEVLEQAQAQLAAGHAWRARDILAQYLETEPDDDVLSMLGGVLYGMGDLPGAGAAWFGTTKSGAEVEAATAAWREHYDDHFGRMWRSLPRAVRRDVHSAKVEALREKAIARDRADGRSPSPRVKESKGVDAAVIIAWILAAFVIVCTIIGLVTVVRWIMPGA